MEKVKVVQIANSLRGGIGTVINTINRFLSRDIFEPSIMLLERRKAYSLEDFIEFKKELDSLDADILHSHGAWYFHLLYFINRDRFGRKVVISPHGAFLEESLKKSRLKKFIASYLYMKRACLNADVVHALTEQEAKSIREYGIDSKPIAIIPNGISFDDKLEIDRELQKRLLRVANGRKVLLFLSRIHYSKGVEVLIDSFSDYIKGSNKKDAVLFIVGYGDSDYIEALKERIRTEGLERDIIFLGKMEGVEKSTVYSISNIFLLPSFHEAFSVTVLEAFRFMIPVITTTNTPFEDIKNLNAGWYIELSKENLYKTLKEALSLSREDLKLKGINGYNWIKKEYNIIRVDAMYEELYLWLVNRGEKPYFVREH